MPRSTTRYSSGKRASAAKRRSTRSTAKRFSSKGRSWRASRRQASSSNRSSRRSIRLKNKSGSAKRKQSRSRSSSSSSSRSRPGLRRLPMRKARKTRSAKQRKTRSTRGRGGSRSQLSNRRPLTRRGKTKTRGKRKTKRAKTRSYVRRSKRIALSGGRRKRRPSARGKTKTKGRGRGRPSTQPKPLFSAKTGTSKVVMSLPNRVLSSKPKSSRKKSAKSKGSKSASFRSASASFQVTHNSLSTSFSNLKSMQQNVQPSGLGPEQELVSVSLARLQQFIGDVESQYKQKYARKSGRGKGSRGSRSRRAKSARGKSARALQTSPTPTSIEGTGGGQATIASQPSSQTSSSAGRLVKPILLRVEPPSPVLGSRSSKQASLRVATSASASL